MIGPCCVRIYGPQASFKGSPCKGKPKVEVDGKVYCGIHDPAAVTRRQDRANQRYAAEQAIKNRRVAEQNEMRRRAGCYDDLLAAVFATQFGFNYRRCPVCAGFNVGPNGETDKVHTKDCIVGLAIKKATQP